MLKFSLYISYGEIIKVQCQLQTCNLVEPHVPVVDTLTATTNHLNG